MLPPALNQDTRLKHPLASRRTGGPRTAEGRARSSFNAIKHGGYVTTSSASQEFQATFSELVSRINPVGVVEEGVVNSSDLRTARRRTLQCCWATPTSGSTASSVTATSSDTCSSSHTASGSSTCSRNAPPANTRAQAQSLHPTPDAGLAQQAGDKSLDAIKRKAQLEVELLEIQAEIERLNDSVAMSMGAAERLTWQGETLATWRLSKGATRLDGERLKRERPDIVESYTVRSPATRRLQITQTH